MTAGIQIFNQNGIEIINSNDPIPFVFKTGTTIADFNNGLVTVNYSGLPEVPTVLIRPKPGGWWYNFTIEVKPSSPNTISFSSYDFVNSRFPPYDWAICSSARGNGLVSNDKYGLEVFDENGFLSFSTGLRFPRILTIQSIKGPFSDGGGTIRNQSATIGANFTSMPWLILNDVKYSLPFPANGDGASSVSFAVNVSNDFKTLNARMSDSLAPQYNQYQNGNMHIPMCVIPGL